MKGITFLGVTGRAQHGKDTIGAYIEQHYAFKRAAFADALKDLALRINPLVYSTGPAVRLASVVAAYGWEEAKKVEEVRRFLQRLGTDIRDVIGDGVWVDALAGKLMPGVRYVLTDCRFPNEVDFCQVDGAVIRVTRPDFDNGVDPNHPSEANVPNLFVNFDIVNDGTLNELYQKVDAVMRDIQEGFIGAPHTLSSTITGSSRYA